MRSSLVEFINDNASDRSKIAFRHRPRLRRKSKTYREISHISNQFARELESRQIGHGDRVAIWAENSPEWVAAFFAIILRGAIAVPLDEQSAPDFVQRVLEKTEPRLLLHGREIDSSSLNVPSIALAELPETVSRHSAEPVESPEIKPEDAAEIVFTSGTTAEPKGVVLTHENLLANLEPMERQIKKYRRWMFIADPIRILCLLPLSHVFGQMMGIFLPQMLGAEVIFQDRLNPSEIIDTIRREHVMVTAAVPRVLETLRHKVETDYAERGELAELTAAMGTERSWPGAWWRYRKVHRMFGLRFMSFVTGGATLDESVETFWRRLGFAVVQGYGMTETAALVSLNNPFSSRRGSLGQILAGHENIRINEKGEILVRGKNISPGYWGEERANDDDGWLNTGDVGSLDDTGRLYFRGRKKEVIVTAAGLNIYPGDLEAALNEQPDTIASAVVETEGPNGPEPAAALILRPGTKAADVVKRANKALAPYQHIRRWMEWPDADFPRTPTQKVRKNVIADTFAQDHIQESETRDPTLAGIISRLGRSFTGSNARLNEDLALDSLSRVELMSAIEDRYQVDLDEQAFSDSTTVGQLEEMIRRSSSRSEAGPRFSFPRWPLRFPMSWIRPVFYELVIYPITRVLCRVNKCGLGNLAEVKGPVVFACNHVTYVDPALVMSAIPVRFRRKLAIAMDGERLRAYLHPPTGTGPIKRIRWFFTYWLVVSFFNAFPLPRKSGFRRSFDFAGDAMDRGYSVLIFPEGELTKDGSIQPFRSGIGVLANGLAAPVIPVAITGLYELRAAGKRGWAPPGKVTIAFGKAISYQPPQTHKSFTTVLEQHIGALHNSESKP